MKFHTGGERSEKTGSPRTPKGAEQGKACTDGIVRMRKVALFARPLGRFFFASRKGKNEKRIFERHFKRSEKKLL